MNDMSHFKDRVVTPLNSFCHSQIHVKQIQAQVIVHNLQSNTTIPYNFIIASQSHNLLLSVLPFFIAASDSLQAWRMF